jgi:hypothetical protein
MPVREQSNSPTGDGKEIYEVFLNYKTKEWETWRTTVSEDLSFNTPGGMWTQSQREDLEARGQAALEIPIIKPQIELQKSQILANPPKFKVIGRTDDDVKKAAPYNVLLDYIWYKSEGNMATDQVVGYQLEASKAYYYIWNDPYGDDGYSIPRIDFLHPLDVVVDSECRRLDEEDAERKFLFREVSFETAKKLFPDKAEMIETLSEYYDEHKLDRAEFGGDAIVKIYDEVVDDERRKLTLLEQQKKIKVKFFSITYNDGENDLTREFSEEEFNNFKESLDPLNPVDNGIIASIQVIEERWRDRVERTVVLGLEVMSTEILPTEFYTIVPVTYEHRGNVYPSSLTRRLKGLQQEVNFRRSLMIAHATSSTNPFMLFAKGVIPDWATFEEQSTRPGFRGEWNPDQTLPNGGVFTAPVQPLPNALFELESVAKQDAQYAGGTFSLSHGDATNAPDTFRATMMLDEFSHRRTSLAAKNLYYALTKVGKIVISFIQEYMTEPRILRVINPYDPYDETATTVGLNTPPPTQEEPDEFAQMVQTTYNSHYVKDVSIGRYDVQVIIGSMSPNNRNMEAELHMKAYHEGIIDDIEVLKKSDIYDREGVMRRKSKLAQATRLIQEQQATIKAISKELEETRDQVQTSAIQVQSAQADTLFNNRVVDLEKKFNDKFLKLDEKIAELNLAKKEVKIDAKIAKSKATSPSTKPAKEK